MKKGLFGFLAGVSFGGLVGLFSAKRKGSALRSDLLKKWDEGAVGLDVLKKDLTEAAQELKKGAKEIYDSPKVKELTQKAGDEIKKTYKQTSDHVKDTAKDISENIKQSFDKKED